MEFKGKIFSNYSKRMKCLQGVTAGIGFSVYNVLDRPLYIITLVQWCGGWQGKWQCSGRGLLPREGV